MPLLHEPLLQGPLPAGPEIAPLVNMPSAV